jgi:hypothetical protein
VVHTHHTIDPGRGHAAFGQRHLDAVEDPGVHLEATPAPRLQHLEEARIDHVLDRLPRNQPVPLRLRGALSQDRRQGTCPTDQRLRLRREPVFIRDAHADDFRRCAHDLYPQ